MKGLLSPSLMCADMLNLQTELKALDDLAVEYVHLDFMDNKFVPNITLNTALIKSVKSVLKITKRDIHIMALEPQKYFDELGIGEGDIVSVHFEACENFDAVLDEICSRGAKAFAAINPDTPVDVLDDYICKIDGILVMTVYPGFAGQPIVEGSFEKIKAVRSFIDRKKPEALLEVDGHVSWDLCGKMRECGADIFVAGSSSVYSGDISFEAAVDKMNKLID